MTIAGRMFRRADAVLAIALTAIVFSVVLASVVSRPVGLDDRARMIESQLRCPTCQGLSIADSPASSATQMRQLVQDQLAAGASDDEVRTFFVARYGRWILLDPPVAGVDVALWLAPALVLALGAFLVIRRAKARNSTGGPTRAWNPPVAGGGRAPTIAIAAGMVFALVVPIAAAVGPRLAGQEVTGGALPQTAASIEDLEAFVKVEPRDLGALVALGDALLAANRAGEAAERYKAALEVDPDSIPALLGIGTILLAADRPDAAEPVFDRILRTTPDQPDALLYRAVARLRLAGTATDRVRADVERFLEVAAQDDPRRGMATGLLDRSGPSAPPASVAPVPTPEP